jgi:hypothetical protein
MTGDTLPNEAATIHVRWADAHEGDLLRFNVDGRPYAERSISMYGISEGCTL